MKSLSVTQNIATIIPNDPQLPILHPINPNLRPKDLNNTISPKNTTYNAFNQSGLNVEFQPMSLSIKQTGRNWKPNKLNLTNTLALDLPKIDLRMTNNKGAKVNSILSPHGTQSFFKAKRYSKAEKTLYKKPIRISPNVFSQEIK